MMPFITVANILSFIRIILIPFIVYNISHGDSPVQLALLIVLAIATDYLDGFCARKFHMITKVGKILDPLADKLAVGAIAVSLTVFEDFPLWVLLFILLRDVLILFAGAVLLKRKRYVPVSNWTGKVTVNVLAVLLIVYMFDIAVMKIYLVILSVVFIVLSLLFYLREMYSVLHYTKNN